MNVGGLLIFLANFAAMYSSGFQQDKTSSQMTLKGEDIFKTKLNKDCPYLLEVVRFVSKNYNLTDYGVNCERVTNENLNEENILQYVCVVVQEFLHFICENKLNMTNNSLKPDNGSFCPFRLAQFEFKFERNELVQELTKNEHCLKVCYDLDKPRPECVILSIFNNYLKSLNLPMKQKVLSPVENSQIKPDETEASVQKTENFVASKKTEQQQANKNETNKPKTETVINKVSEPVLVTAKTVKVDNKTEKPETVVSTPIKEQTSESEVKATGNENFMQHDTEDESNEDGLVSIDNIPLGETPVTNSPKVESFEDKNFVSSSKIYSGDEFFQAEDSHFFFYFIMVSSIIVVGYLAFHNKNKILAYALEGTSGRRRGRRPNPARYRKLETNLEEVISSSSTNVAASSVVY